MKGFNYLAAAQRRKPLAFGTTIAIDNRIRGPLAALVAIVVLTCAIGAVQLSRLGAAAQAYSVTSAQLAASELTVRSVKRLRARLDAQAQVADRIDEIRRTSLQRVSELAWIGNHLPRDTWLHAVRYEDGTYSLEGSSARAGAVGNAILALRENTRAAAVRLVSLHADASTKRIDYTLRLEPNP